MHVVSCYNISDRKNVMINSHISPIFTHERSFQIILQKKKKSFAPSYNLNNFEHTGVDFLQ